MLGVIFLCTVLIGSMNAAVFTDMNCTNMDAANTKFVSSATSCSDKYSTSACTTLFGTAVIEMGEEDRDSKCSRDEVGVNQELKQLAISTCPKHCGYCCETPEYKCDNKPFPRVKCETVSQAQCANPVWREILAEDCPKVCGLCLAGGCVDKVVECVNDPAICRQIDMQEFVKENCQRTCGYCAKKETNATDCLDTSAFCAKWARNGFCTNSYYTETQRRQSCAKTCNLC